MTCHHTHACTTIVASYLFPCSNTCSEPVNRVGLHRFSPHMDTPTVAQQDRVITARTFCSNVLSSSLATRKKLEAFERLWPQVLARTVHDIVQEYTDMDHHMRAALDQL